MKGEQNDMGFNTAKLKRGFYWWVALTFAGAIGVLWYALDASYRGRLDDKDSACEKRVSDKDSVIIAQQRVINQKDNEIAEWKYYVVPKMRAMQGLVEETKEIADTVYSNYLKNKKR